MNNFPAGIYLLKVNNRNTRTRCEICSKLTINKDTRTTYKSITSSGLLNFELNPSFNENDGADPDA